MHKEYWSSPNIPWPMLHSLCWIISVICLVVGQDRKLQASWWPELCYLTWQRSQTGDPCHICMLELGYCEILHCPKFLVHARKWYEIKLCTRCLLPALMYLDHAVFCIYKGGGMTQKMYIFISLSSLFLCYYENEISPLLYRALMKIFFADSYLNWNNCGNYFMVLFKIWRQLC